MLEDQIKITTPPDEEAAAQLKSQLIAYNHLRVPQQPPREILLSIQDDNGDLLAGLSGRISYTWLFVDLFWVAEHLRGQGYGTRLLQQAEQYAREQGCHAVWLDTYSFQARGFYEKQGYKVFGQLPRCPGEHSRYFLCKELS
ncbi:N-acetyltransferase [Acidobacterium sp. S8]|uniref:GNAT family N-acetyltransferase n=1 Tax=Acidobacterium sp. S8 TaxID=1641854 RepID=UPI00131C5249|nr:GNAT family N-acetyltransferase [Acidobacterium sp. S8]